MILLRDWVSPRVRVIQLKATNWLQFSYKVVIMGSGKPVKKKIRGENRRSIKSPANKSGMTVAAALTMQPMTRPTPTQILKILRLRRSIRGPNSGRSKALARVAHEYKSPNPTALKPNATVSEGTKIATENN